MTDLIGETLAAASIFILPYVAIWGYYGLTGEYMEF